MSKREPVERPFLAAGRRIEPERDQIVHERRVVQRDSETELLVYSLPKDTAHAERGLA